MREGPENKLLILTHITSCFFSPCRVRRTLQPTAKMARSSSLLVLAACALAFYGLQSAFVAAPGQALRGAEAFPMSGKLC